MSRRWAAGLVVLAVVILLGTAVWWGRSRPAAEVENPASAALPAPVAEPPKPENAPWKATLWLPGPRERIGPLEVEVESGESTIARARALLAALVAARPEPPLAPLFDTEVSADASVLTPDGTLFVDLRSADGGEPPGSGSALELQRVYAIVHTLLRNEPTLRHVVLLWNGTQRTALAGHVDTGHALSLLPGIEMR